MLSSQVQAQTPEQIRFTRQAAKRIVFDKEQSIVLSELEPEKIVGLPIMHPHLSKHSAKISILGDELMIQADKESNTSLWLGGFNPFAVYSLSIVSARGEGAFGFKFSDASEQEEISILEAYKDSVITDLRFKVVRNNVVIIDSSILVNNEEQPFVQQGLLLQMLGSGLVVYNMNNGLPKIIGQLQFNKYVDFRDKKYLNSFNTSIQIKQKHGALNIRKAEIALSAGMGLADIRPITYENGDPLLDQGRLWYTMSIRGWSLPNPIQGVFSMNPSVFDIKFEGIVVFDRNDGLLRNEVASHIFYDRKDKMWRGVTTGFSAYANPDKEQKQLLVIESKRDPRKGFSIMDAKPFKMVGDIEDPQILFDSTAQKWRMIACKNQEGYKAVLLESDYWNKGYEQIAGPVAHNSTGTSIQRIGNQLFCFSGSSDSKLYVYSYPDLKEVGILNMDLPPWNETSGSRIWPNVVQLPEGYPFKYVALMMDRLNYPGIKGPNWTYGALYLYHGF